MAKSKIVTPKIDPEAVNERVRRALTKLKKEQLVELLVELARNNALVMRTVEANVELEDPPLDELLMTTQEAIEVATYFNRRDVGHNFVYDYLAYEAIERNFLKLIELGGLEKVMELAVELMKLGSYQVSVSDEGLMADDIESCLNVVFAAVRKSKLEKQQVHSWCESLTKADRTRLIGIAHIRELQKLRT